MPVAAQAQSVGSLGIAVGTQGFGLEGGVDLGEQFAVRAAGNYFRISRGFDGDDVHYDGRLRLMSVGLMGDFFPFESGVHVTGGAYLNRNNARLNATPTSNVEIGGTTYTPTQIGTLTGCVKYKALAPYAGLGYTGNRGGTGLSFTFDAGALFQGGSKVTLTSNGTSSAASTFAADLDRERADVADDIDKLKIYPVVKVGLACRF